MFVHRWKENIKNIYKLCKANNEYANMRTFKWSDRKNVRPYIKRISVKRTDGVKGGAVSVKDKRDARGVKADSALSPRSGTMTRSIHISITTLTLSNLQPSLHC